MGANARTCCIPEGSPASRILNPAAQPQNATPHACLIPQLSQLLRKRNSFVHSWSRHGIAHSHAAAGQL